MNSGSALLARVTWSRNAGGFRLQNPRHFRVLEGEDAA